MSKSKNGITVYKVNKKALIVMLYLSNSFYFNGNQIIQKLLIWSLCGLYLILNLNEILRMLKNGRKKIYVNNDLVILCLFLVFVFIAPVIHQTMDFSYIASLNKLLSGTMYALVPLIMISKDKRIDNKFDSFVLTFSISMAAYVLGTVVLLVFPSIKQVVMDLIYISSRDMQIVSKTYYVTRFGWAGMSGFTTAIKCVLAIVFSLYLFIKTLDEKKKTLFPFVLISLNLLGCFFYARTGVLIGIICILISFSTIFENSRRISSFFKYLVIMIIFLIIAVPYIFEKFKTNTAFSWIMELFINLESGKGFETDSSNSVMNMYKVNLTSTTFFIGDGYYLDSSGVGYYKKVDVGYLRMILYYGIFGLITQYSSYVYAIKGMVKTIKEKYMKLLAFMLIIMLFLFEMKGETWVVLMPYIFCLLLVCETRVNKKGIV